MDIMDLLAQARPGSLDPRPDADRRARDLAMAMATPRAGDAAVRPGAAGRPGVRRPARPASMIAIGTASPRSRAPPGPWWPSAAPLRPRSVRNQARRHAGTAGSGELKHAILTAVNGVWGDVFNFTMTEIYAGQRSKYDGVPRIGAIPSGRRRRDHCVVVACASVIVPGNHERQNRHRIHLHGARRRQGRAPRPIPKSSSFSTATAPGLRYRTSRHPAIRSQRRPACSDCCT